MPQINNNCIVTLESRQIMLGDEEVTSISVPASKTKRNGKTYISYTVYYDDAEEWENKEILKIVSNDCIELIRQGFLKAKMVFKKGETAVCDYTSPAGKMILSVDTLDLAINDSPQLTQIDLKYKIELDSDAEILVYFKFTAQSGELPEKGSI